ncbi:hypothetical protein MMYC01_209155 [Madurella mycetomatis]|uniref:Uncharacterized protein n=1 Tax=Madurella mycetomatis TaxID=100816 RepID=A0A175VS99_9PEZI|nr:hypothetical protein MMYC01_209155 [Madurella mycetomatis]
MSKINYYLQTASSLHRLATTRLFQTQALLADRLDHTILSPDGSFLAETEAHTKKLSLPLDKFTVGSQQAVKEFEEEVGGLWREWAVAEAEV